MSLHCRQGEKGGKSEEENVEVHAGFGCAPVGRMLQAGGENGC